MGLEEPSTSEIIRDIQAEVQAIRAGQDAFVVRELHEAELVRVKAVSYTHLTLPTILLV